MIIETGWFLGLLPLGEDQIKCDSCGFTEPSRKAVGTQTWHVGTQSVMTLRGKRVAKVMHLCKGCVEQSDELGPFPGVDFYFVGVW